MDVIYFWVFEDNKDVFTILSCCMDYVMLDIFVITILYTAIKSLPVKIHFNIHFFL